MVNRQQSLSSRSRVTFIKRCCTLRPEKKQKPSVCNKDTKLCNNLVPPLMIYSLPTTAIYSRNRKRTTILLMRTRIKAPNYRISWRAKGKNLFRLLFSDEGPKEGSFFTKKSSQEATPCFLLEKNKLKYEGAFLSAVLWKRTAKIANTRSIQKAYDLL